MATSSERKLPITPTSSERRLPLGLPPPSAGDLSQEALWLIPTLAAFYGPIEDGYWQFRSELDPSMARELIRHGIVKAVPKGLYTLTPKGVAMARMLSLS